MSGLLIAGQVVPVPGVTVIGPHDATWSHLDPGDWRPRTNHPSMVILHKTKGDDPERIVEGTGSVGRAERVAEYWQSNPEHSGAHMVIDGHVAACLADLELVEAYHANQANHRAIGIEHYEELGGITFQGTIDNAVPCWRAIAVACGIQLQFPRLGTYHGQPMARFTDGGSTLVGFFGHRDVTNRRGRWDPGDAVFAALAIHLGAEDFDFEAGEDLVVWKGRQLDLVARGHKLIVDGIPGPLTTAALKAEGYEGGIWALGRAA